MITLTATEESRQDINELAAFFEGLSSPTLEQKTNLGNAIRNIFSDNFANEGPSENPWHELKDMTKWERLHEGFPPDHPIHYRTGSLEESFTARGNSEHVEEYTLSKNGWILEIGSQDWRLPRLEGELGRPIALFGTIEDERVGDTLDQIFADAADTLGYNR